MNCIKCVFFERTGNNANGPYGQCRRRAPLYIADWPVVFKGDWCGEFEIKPLRLVEADPQGEDTA